MNATATTAPQPARASLGWAALRLQSDEELGELVRDGYEQAFDAIVERHRGAAAALLDHAGRRRPRRGRRPAGVREGAATTCATTSASLPCAPGSTASATTSRSTCCSARGPTTSSSTRTTTASRSRPTWSSAARTCARCLKQVRGLPDRQRSALMLSAVGGMSYDQIADDMHVTPPVVRQLLYRARVTLRDALGAAVPAPVIRLWLAGAGPDHSQIAELVAGGGAGAGMVKAGAAVMAASVVATGAGVTASHRAHTTSTPTASHHSAAARRRSATGAAAEPGDGPPRRRGPAIGTAAGRARAATAPATAAARVRRGRPRRWRWRGTAVRASPVTAGRDPVVATTSKPNPAAITAARGGGGGGEQPEGGSGPGGGGGGSEGGSGKSGSGGGSGESRAAPEGRKGRRAAPTAAVGGPAAAAAPSDAQRPPLSVIFSPIACFKSCTPDQARSSDGSRADQETGHACYKSSLDRLGARSAGGGGRLARRPPGARTATTTGFPTAGSAATSCRCRSTRPSATRTATGSRTAVSSAPAPTRTTPTPTTTASTTPTRTPARSPRSKTAC